MLVVEDNKSSLEYMAKDIPWEEYGVTVTGQALNGKIAWNLAEKSTPDILLTDIRMPVMDGLKLIELFREKGLDTQVIILSAYDDFFYAQQAIRLGITEYVLKPVDDFQLIEAVLKAKHIILEQRKKEEREKWLLEQEKEYETLRNQKFWNELTELCKRMTLEEGSERSEIVHATEFIKNHYMEELTAELVAHEVGLTPNYFSHIFKKVMRVSFSSFVRNVRIEKAKELLLNTDITSARISEMVGFSDQQYFSHIFKKVTGNTPTEYKRKGGICL